MDVIVKSFIKIHDGNREIMECAWKTWDDWNMKGMNKSIIDEILYEFEFLGTVSKTVVKFGIKGLALAAPIALAMVTAIPILIGATLEIIKGSALIQKVYSKTNIDREKFDELREDVVKVLKVLTVVAGMAFAASLLGAASVKKFINFGITVSAATASGLTVLLAGKALLWTQEKLKLDSTKVEPLVKDIIAIIGALALVVGAIMAADALVPKDIVDKLINFGITVSAATASGLTVLLAGKALLWTQEKLKLDSTKVEPLVKDIIAIIGALALVVGAIMAADALVPKDIVDKLINFGITVSAATAVGIAILLAGKALFWLQDKLKIEASNIEPLLKAMGAALVAITTIVAAVLALESIAPSDIVSKLIDFAIQTGVATLVSSTLIGFIWVVNKGIEKVGVTPEKCLAIGKALGSVVALVSSIAAGSAGSAKLINALGGVANIALYFIMAELVKLLVGRLIKIIELVDKLPNSKTLAKKSGKMLQLMVFIGAVTLVAAATAIAGAFALPAILASPFVLLFLMVLPAVIKMLKFAIKSLDKHKFNPKSKKSIVTAAMIIGSLAAIELSILAVGILALPTIICAPIVLIMMLTFILMFWVMRKMLRIVDSLIGFNVTKGLASAALLLLGLIAIELLVLLVALAAPAVIKSTLSVLLVFGAIILILAAAALLGYGVLLVQPLLIAAAYAIVITVAVMTIIVLSVFLMALMLEKLQMISIDRDAVKENVKIIIACVWDIVAMVFNDESVNPKKNSFWDSLLGMTGMVLSALAASVILVMSVVSVFCILLIAGLLRILQIIELDPDRITTNVDLVLGTARKIIDKLFGDPEATATEDKNANNTEAVVKHSGDGILITIVKAICAIAFLALTVFSVLCILLIASMLRVLQEIELDPDKINRNIELVLGTARSIIDILFNNDIQTKDENPPGFWETLLRKFAAPIVDVIQAIMSVAYLAMIMVSIFLIMGIAGQLKLLEKIELDPELITQKVNAIMDSARACIAAINKKDDTKSESGKSWIRKLLDLIGLGDFVEAIMNIGYLALIYASIGLVGNIAERLEQFSKFNISKETTLNKVSTIIDTANAVVLKIKATKNDDAKDAAKSITKYAEKVLKSLDIVQQVAAKLDKIGQFNQSNLSTSKANIESIFNSLIATYNNTKLLPSDVDKYMQRSTMTIGYAIEYCKRISNLHDVARNLDESELNATKSKVSTGISIMSEIIALMDEIKPTMQGNRVRNNCDLMDKISQTVGSFVQVDDKDVKNSKNITENYIKFFKQVDSMDIKKLQHTDWLMRSWASISRDLKGNFEGLAKTINQHIMPMLDKVNETLEKTTKAQQDIIDALSKPVDINMGGTDSPSIDTPDETTPPGGATQPGGTTPGKSDPGPETANKKSQNSTGAGTTKAPRLQGAGNMTVDFNKTYRVKFADFKDA